MGAALGGFDDLAGGGETGGENDESLWARLECLGEEFHAIHGLAFHGGNDHGNGCFFQDFESLRRIVAAKDGEIFCGEMLGGPVQEVQVRVNQQQRILFGFLRHGVGEMQAGSRPKARQKIPRKTGIG